MLTRRIFLERLAGTAGAGLAGLTVAYELGKLGKLGYKTTILEARMRVPGYICQGSR